MSGFEQKGVRIELITLFPSRIWWYFSMKYLLYLLGFALVALVVLWSVWQLLVEVLFPLNFLCRRRRNSARFRCGDSFGRAVGTI